MGRDAASALSADEIESIQSFLYLFAQCAGQDGYQPTVDDRRAATALAQRLNSGSGVPSRAARGQEAINSPGLATITLTLRLTDLPVVKDALCDAVLCARREAKQMEGSQELQALWHKRQSDAERAHGVLGRILVATHDAGVSA